MPQHRPSTAELMADAGRQSESWDAGLPWRLQERARRVESLAAFADAVRRGEAPSQEAQRLIADAIAAWLAGQEPLEHALGFRSRRGGRDETAPALYRRARTAGVVVLSGNADIRRPPDVAAIFGAWKR